MINPNLNLEISQEKRAKIFNLILEISKISGLPIVEYKVKSGSYVIMNNLDLQITIIENTGELSDLIKAQNVQS